MEVAREERGREVSIVSTSTLPLLPPLPFPMAKMIYGFGGSFNFIRCSL